MYIYICMYLYVYVCVCVYVTVNVYVYVYVLYAFIFPTSLIVIPFSSRVGNHLKGWLLRYNRNQPWQMAGFRVLPLGGLVIQTELTKHCSTQSWNPRCFSHCGWLTRLTFCCVCEGSSAISFSRLYSYLSYLILSRMIGALAGPIHWYDYNGLLFSPWNWESVNLSRTETFFLPTVEISNCCLRFFLRFKQQLLFGIGSGIPNQIFLRRLGQHNCTEDEIKKAADSSKYISWIDMGRHGWVGRV